MMMNINKKIKSLENKIDSAESSYKNNITEVKRIDKSGNLILGKTCPMKQV